MISSKLIFILNHLNFYSVNFNSYSLYFVILISFHFSDSLDILSYSSGYMCNVLKDFLFSLPRFSCLC